MNEHRGAQDADRAAVLGEVVHDSGCEPDSGWFIVGVGGYFDMGNACWCADDPDNAPWTSERFDLFGTVDDLIATRLTPSAGGQPMSAHGDESGIAAVLADHSVCIPKRHSDPWKYDGTYVCKCGGEFVAARGMGGALVAHRAHQAAALAEAGYGHVGQARAEALREAADELDDHSVCSCEPDNHVAFVAGSDWLRVRADREADR